MAVHFLYHETPAFVVEGFAAGGHFLQAREQEAG
jgi:hypothetical protein